MASKYSAGSFLVAGGVAAELLEPINAALDQLAPVAGLAMILEWPYWVSKQISSLSHHAEMLGGACVAKLH